MKKCNYCGYNLGPSSGGCCEYCKEIPHYGKTKNIYSQHEKKSEKVDADLEEMTDGDYINCYGVGEFIKDEAPRSEG